MAHERVCPETSDAEQRNQHIERYNFGCMYARNKDVPVARVLVVICLQRRALEKP